MESPPSCKRLTQVAVVVRDLEASMSRYWSDLGIGPWSIYHIHPANTPDMQLRGQPVQHAFRAAVTSIGDIELELIEPVSGESVYAEFLASRGEGLHHIAIEVADLSALRRHMNEKGYREIQAGRPFDVGTYVYFDTYPRLGAILEFGNLDSSKELPRPERIWPVTRPKKP